MLALEDLKKHSAISDLHNELSEWAHTADPPEFIVRRLLADRDVIDIDIVGLHTKYIDRFTVTIGRKNIMAVAGTLELMGGGGFHEWPRSSFQTGDLQCWMREIVAGMNLQLVAPSKSSHTP